MTATNVDAAAVAPAAGHDATISNQPKSNGTIVDIAPEAAWASPSPNPIEVRSPYRHQRNRYHLFLVPLDCWMS